MNGPFLQLKCRAAGFERRRVRAPERAALQGYRCVVHTNEMKVRHKVGEPHRSRTDLEHFLASNAERVRHVMSCYVIKDGASQTSDASKLMQFSHSNHRQIVDPQSRDHGPIIFFGFKQILVDVPHKLVESSRVRDCSLSPD
jgi:hypothetical protein